MNREYKIYKITYFLMAVNVILFNFIFKARLLRWRGYAFFSWCKSREQ